MKIQQIKQKAVPVLKRYDIKRAGLFGSVARGEGNSNSDIDIAVEIKKSISLFQFIRIKLELEKVLKRRVDLVEYKTIKPMLKQRILNEEVGIL